MPPRRLSILAMPFVLAMGLSASCVEQFFPDDCNRVVCQNAGFVATIARLDGAKLPEGDYAVSVVSDGETFKKECRVGDGQDQYCFLTSYDPNDPDTELEIRFEYIKRSGRLDIRIQNREPADIGGSITGPENVKITIDYGDQPVVSENYRPEYERTEPAGEGCGFCERANFLTNSKPVEIPDQN